MLGIGFFKKIIDVPLSYKVLQALKAESPEFRVEYLVKDYVSSIFPSELFESDVLCLTLGDIPPILLATDFLTFTLAGESELINWGTGDENLKWLRMTKGGGMFLLSGFKIDIVLSMGTGIKVILGENKSFIFSPSKSASMSALADELSDARCIEEKI